MNDNTKPARRLRHGERPTETLVFDEPAATSGDAPADLQQLKALALAAWPGKWKVGETYADMYDDGPGAPETVIRDESGEAGIAVCIDFGDNNPAIRDSNAAYIAAFSPAVVLDLIARIERAAAPAEPLRKAEELPATASGDELPSIVTPKFIELSIAHREAYNAHAAFSGSAEVRTAWKAMTDHIDAHTRAAVSAATKPTADLPKAE